MKIAIVVVCFNNLAYTKVCLDSVFRHTFLPFKLYLVDNGSTDNTLKYFNKIYSDYNKLGESKPNIQIIHSDTNLGFGPGNNLALEEIKKDDSITHILLLNNDTLVTPGYLERMLDCLNRHPKAGIVGPMTNFAGGRQALGGISIDPSDFVNVNKFANEHYEKNKGKDIETGRIVALCWLMKREVFDSVGGFDPIYERGMWEDNDLALRATEAGYQIYIAYDTFIWHFGSKTVQIVDAFKGKELFETNRQRFFDKWAGLHNRGGHKKVVGMIRVQNGAHFLNEVLTKVSEMVDEIVVFDDKSTDNTVEICHKYPKVVNIITSQFIDMNEARDRAFVFKMAAERNPDWIYCFDSDEVPEDKLIRDIQKLVNPENPEVKLYCFKICHMWQATTDDTSKECTQYRTDLLWGSFWQGRLFKYNKYQTMGGVEGEVNYHCGSHPSIPPENQLIIPYRIKHYGNMDPKLRAKKYLWYTINDKVKDVGNILGAWVNHYKSLYWRLEQNEKSK